MTNQQITPANGNTAVQQREPDAQDHLRSYLARPAVVERLKAVASKYLRPEEMIRLTLVAASKTPKIATCTPESVLRCLLEASAIGIRPGGILGRGWLIPRWNSKIKANELTFDPGWRGLADVAKRSGVVKRIEAHVVRERDHFRAVQGTQPRLEHEPYDGTEDPGAVRHAYAVAFFEGGEAQFEIVPRAELERVMAVSSSKNDKGESVGPWQDWPEEMARKTAVRRLCKYLPYDEELEATLEIATRAEILETPFPDIRQVPQEEPAAKRLAKNVRKKNEAAPLVDADSAPPDDVPLTTDDEPKRGREPGED